MFVSWFQLSLQNYRFFAANSSTRKKAISQFICCETLLLKRLLKIGYFKQSLVINYELNTIRLGLFVTKPNATPLPPWIMMSEEFDECVTALVRHHLIELECLKEMVSLDTNLLSFDLDKLISWRKEHFNFLDVDNKSVSAQKNSHAVYIHLYYPDLWGDISEQLKYLPNTFDVLITVPDYTCVGRLLEIADSFQHISIYKVKNIGRDIFPFLQLLSTNIFDGYSSVCKLHSKKSLHTKIGKRWFDSTVASLLGSRSNIEVILKRFETDSRLGLIGPSEYFVRNYILGNDQFNEKNVRKILEQISVSPNDMLPNYFAGTMFWFRPQALDLMKNLKLPKEFFPHEMKQTDGTIMHAFERLFGTFVDQAGFGVSVIEKQLENHP
jgi:lipopolysaccharide biosynthesis protein